MSFNNISPQIRQRLLMLPVDVRSYVDVNDPDFEDTLRFLEKQSLQYEERVLQLAAENPGIYKEQLEHLHALFTEETGFHRIDSPLVLALEKKDVVGALWYDNVEDSLYIDELIVHPNHRGKKYATRLVYEMMELHFDEALSVQLSALHSAVGFYRRLGFIMGDVDNDSVSMTFPFTENEKRVPFEHHHAIQSIKNFFNQ